MTESLVKETQNGSLRGAWADTARTIQVFRGVPFAQPPVRELRWRPPAPLAVWTGIKSAETFADACYQEFSEDAFVWSRGEFKRSEDCLYLNIWASADQKSPCQSWCGSTAGLIPADSHMCLYSMALS